MRCDHCENRNNLECGDGWNRISNDYICERFCLDFSTLSEKQKEEIQRRLMRSE